MDHLVCFVVKFQLESLSIKYTTDSDAAEKLREETRPGAPHITFSVKPFVRVVLENPIPRSGLFTANVTISEGDNMKIFHEKVGKAIQVKGFYIFMILSIILGIILNSSIHFRTVTFENISLRRSTTWSTKNSDFQRLQNRKNYFTQARKFVH